MYTIGCSGVITHVERLPDGRYNIVLRGLERFRILGRITGELPPRRPSTRWSSARPRPPIATAIRAAAAPSSKRCSRRPIEKADALPSGAHADPRTASAMTDEDLVNALAQYLDLEPLEKQALLEHDSLRSRAESLVELLEMKILMARTPCVSHVPH